MESRAPWSSQPRRHRRVRNQTYVLHMFYFIHLHSTSTSRRHTHAISCVRLGRLGLSIDHMCVNAEQIYLTPDAAIAAIHTCDWTLTSMHMYTCMYNVCVRLCTCIEKCKKMWICTEDVENKCTYGSQGISNTLLNKVNRSPGGNNQLTVNKVCQLWWRFFVVRCFFFAVEFLGCDQWGIE
jgi:hypothetical protein